MKTFYLAAAMIIILMVMVIPSFSMAFDNEDQDTPIRPGYQSPWIDESGDNMDSESLLAADTIYYPSLYKQRYQQYVDEMMAKALMENDWDNMEQLLDSGADVNLRRPIGNATNLMVAAGHGKIRIVLMLLGKGARIDLVDDEGRDALMWAILPGHSFECAHVLVEAGADVNRTSTKSGWSALMEAVYANEYQTARLLVQQGASMATIGKNGWTAAVIAARMVDDVEILTYFVENRLASVDDVDGQNRSLLTHAAYSCGRAGSNKTIDFLVDRGARRNASAEVICAAQQGNYCRTKMLLLLGADVNATDDEGYTALQYVSKTNFIDIAKMLLRRGADIERRDRYGMTPLMNSVSMGHVRMTRYLLKNGANYRAIDAGSWESVMDMVVSRTPTTVREDMTKVLIEWAKKSVEDSSKSHAHSSHSSEHGGEFFILGTLLIKSAIIVGSCLVVNRLYF